MNAEALLTTSRISRRCFGNRLLLASTGLPFVATRLDIKAVQKSHPIIAYPPMKIEGAESVMPGSYLYFNYPSSNDSAVLVRNHDGQYHAFSRTCSHLGCSVDFDVARSCLACPCHEGVYDAQTGFALLGPPPRPLDLIALQIQAGGQVWAVGKGNPRRSDE